MVSPRRTAHLDERPCLHAVVYAAVGLPGGYTHGPRFRAWINGGGPLSYHATFRRWQKYCAAAGIKIDIHQLRHAHATELINAGVSIEVVPRRLGHASTETTQIYTLLADQTADDEIRAARRKRDRTQR